MKDKIILILKGILMYLTITYSVLYLLTAESLLDNGWLVQASIILAILNLLCYKYISVRDFIKLSFTLYLERLWRK